MYIAKRFEILRNIECSPTKSIPMAERPILVAVLIDEEQFESSGYQLAHRKSIFIDDLLHDWRWQVGQFYYYARRGDVCDVLVVYEHAKPIAKTVDKAEACYCIMCGKKLQKATSDAKCTPACQ